MATQVFGFRKGAIDEAVAKIKLQIVHEDGKKFLFASPRRPSDLSRGRRVAIRTVVKELAA